MITWAEFRQQLRRSVLKDIDEITWTDDQALDFIGWALDTFSAHTAMEKELLVTGVTGTTVPVPSDIYDNLEVSGLLYLRKGGQTLYIDSREFPEETSHISYRTWQNVIELSHVPETGSTLHIRYFSYWPHPLLDTDLILAPQWSYPALTYLVGSFALGPVGIASANINQWKDRTDSGNPEHNALRAQQKWFLQMYEQEIARYPKQNRSHYWRRDGHG
jgi:hypothetical protein